jgi:hypothetical protein
MRDIVAVIRSWGRRGRDAQCTAPRCARGYGQLRVCTVGLCYDMPSVEAMPFPIAVPDKPPWTLS